MNPNPCASDACKAKMCRDAALLGAKRLTKRATRLVEDAQLWDSRLKEIGRESK